MKLEKVIKNCWCWNEINNLAIEAFPPEEYLAPDKLIKMSKEDNFDFYYIEDNSKFIGFVVVQTYKNLAYLFFLAIAKEYRLKGYGGKTLKLLKEIYPSKTQVVDFEMVDVNSANYNQRVKRREFYLKNGYQETGFFLSYLGVDYEVFCSSNDSFDEDTFKELMTHINVVGFNPKYFRK